MLAEDDEQFLLAQGWDFETGVDGGLINLTIRGYDLPPGYDAQKADLLLRLPAGFPDARPDMFWLCPPVAFEVGGQPAGSEQREQYEGRTWQRWSRHLSDGDWRPGVDSLQSYLRFVRTNLQAAAGGNA